jgi:hypothetical protein
MGMVDTARQVIGRHLTQLTRVQNACRSGGGQWAWYEPFATSWELYLTQETRARNACR